MKIGYARVSTDEQSLMRCPPAAFGLKWTPLSRGCDSETRGLQHFVRFAVTSLKSRLGDLPSNMLREKATNLPLVCHLPLELGQPAKHGRHQPDAGGRRYAAAMSRVEGRAS